MTKPPPQANQDRSAGEPGPLSWRTTPRRLGAAHRPPVDDREQLLRDVFRLLMAADDTNRLDADTITMVETLPWDQITLMRDTLTKSTSPPTKPVSDPR